MDRIEVRKPAKKQFGVPNRFSKILQSYRKRSAEKKASRKKPPQFMSPTAQLSLSNMIRNFRERSSPSVSTPKPHDDTTQETTFFSPLSTNNSEELMEMSSIDLDFDVELEHFLERDKHGEEQTVVEIHAPPSLSPRTPNFDADDESGASGYP
jgi:hypothetical protein